MQRKQTIELWVLDEARAECLTLIEIGGKHRLLRARYYLGAPECAPELDSAALSSCSALEFLQLLSSSIARARRQRHRYELYWPEDDALRCLL